MDPWNERRGGHPSQNRSERVQRVSGPAREIDPAVLQSKHSKVKTGGGPVQNRSGQGRDPDVSEPFWKPHERGGQGAQNRSENLNRRRGRTLRTVLDEARSSGANARLHSVQGVHSSIYLIYHEPQGYRLPTVQPVLVFEVHLHGPDAHAPGTGWRLPG